VRVPAVFRTAALSPRRSADVCRSPLVSVLTGARLAHHHPAFSVSLKTPCGPPVSRRYSAIVGQLGRGAAWVRPATLKTQHRVDTAKAVRTARSVAYRTCGRSARFPPTPFRRRRIDGRDQVAHLRSSALAGSSLPPACTRPPKTRRLAEVSAGNTLARRGRSRREGSADAAHNALLGYREAR
jgi:hypothetical protein